MNVCLCDVSQSDKLQINAGITLWKPITEAHQSEAIKYQTAVVIGAENQATNVPNIHFHKQQSKQKGEGTQ